MWNGEMEAPPPGGSGSLNPPRNFMHRWFFLWCNIACFKLFISMLVFPAQVRNTVLMLHQKSADNLWLNNWLKRTDSCRNSIYATIEADVTFEDPVECCWLSWNDPDVLSNGPCVQWFLCPMFLVFSDFHVRSYVQRPSDLHVQGDPSV